MPDAGRCAAVKGVFLLQRGLCQPQRILGKVVLQRHHMIHLFNVGICRGGKLQKGIPLLPIARIPLQKVPCTGIALFTDADAIEGQGRKALLGSGTGGGIGLFGFRSRLAHIACKGLCFVLEGVLHRVADGVVDQQRIKGAHRPLTCHGSNASGKHGDQQNCGKPCRDLAAQGYTALRGFVPCHTLSLLPLQHPVFFISIMISRKKCNCKKHRFPQRNRCLQTACQAVSGSTAQNDSAW